MKWMTFSDEALGFRSKGSKCQEKIWSGTSGNSKKVCEYSESKSCNFTVCRKGSVSIAAFLPEQISFKF